MYVAVVDGAVPETDTVSPGAAVGAGQLRSGDELDDEDTAALELLVLLLRLLDDDDEEDEEEEDDDEELLLDDEEDEEDEDDETVANRGVRVAVDTAMDSAAPAAPSSWNTPLE